uniref:Reverse transcriptase domain-containing protein n=1 Tax=Tanacetum cinerariifolium TaxID=118510 RepID=A0A699GQN3_TANCI|nr:hypothetical protein [Tanacetum cinerariifolium]
MKFPQHYLMEMQEVILLYNRLDVLTRQLLDSKGVIPTKTAVNAKIAIQEMPEYSQKWYNGTSRTRSTETSNGLAAIQAQLNNLRREIKKRHEEKSNLIKEIQASTNADIKSQGASIKTLEIQIGKMSKVLEERGFGSLISSTKTNPMDHVKLISTTFEVDITLIRRIRSSQYAVSDHPNTPMPEDVKVPLILGRPFLSTAHAKIDVFKRKITLRVGDEKIIFESIKPSSSLIKRVYMLSLRERIEFDLEARLMGETLVLNRSLDPLYGDYIELNDLNVPLEPRRYQVDDLMPTIKEGEVIDEPIIDIIKTRNDESFDEYPSFYVIFGEPFCKASCVEARRFDGLITIHNDEWNLASILEAQEFLQGGLELRIRIYPRCENGRMAHTRDLTGKEIDKVGEVSIIWNPMCVVVMLEGNASFRFQDLCLRQELLEYMEVHDNDAFKSSEPSWGKMFTSGT